MELRSLLTDERAVSPVIAVILMVAVTVILAAVVGTTVLGAGQGVEPNPAPQASFGFDFNESSQKVDVNHRGGDRIEVGENAQRVAVVSAAGTSETWIDSPGQSISAGETKEDVDYGAPEATVRVVWEGAKNDSSATLAQQQAPA
jgi:archaeal flagellin N-terminal-like domain